MSDEEDFKGFQETEESEEEDFSGESGDDFSASEDEWRPENTVNAETDSSDDDAFQEPPPRKNKRFSLNISHHSQKRKRNGRVSLSLNATKNHIPLSQTIKTPTLIKKTISKDEESDSGSSGDDCLVDPNKIDLQSSFFNRNNNSDSNNVEKEPVFECDGGMKLTDSEDEDEMEMVDGEKSTTNLFTNFFDFNKNVEQVKEQIQKIKMKNTVEQNVDVSSLLAIGESSKPTIKKIKNLKKFSEHSDSDWEEVEEQELHETTVKDVDLQVIVAMPQRERHVKKITDEQASLMRQLNRVIKENHLMAHKVSLLCHIAHGIYLNRALNNINLMKEALKLLPNNSCYPDGRTEIKYFESISKWYKSVMKIKSDEMFSTLKKRPSIPQSLALQIKYKEAICKKDYLLIFIVLLRSMGIQCRLVMNLVPLPLRPTQNDLCTIKLKKPNDDQDKKKSIAIKSGKTEEKIQGNIKKSEPKDKIKSEENLSPRKTRKQSRSSERNNIAGNKVNNQSTIKEEKIQQSIKKSEPKAKVKSEEKMSPRKTRKHSRSSERNNIAGNKVKNLSTINEESESNLSSRSTTSKTNIKSQENIVPHKKTTVLKTKTNTEAGTMKTIIPEIKIIQPESSKSTKKNTIRTDSATKSKQEKNRSPSPKFHISPLFTQSKSTIAETTSKKLSTNKKSSTKNIRRKSTSPNSQKIHISPLFTQTKTNIIDSTETNKKMSIRTRSAAEKTLSIPQLDGGNEEPKINSKRSLSDKVQKAKPKKRNPSSENSDDIFQISPPKKSKPSTSSKSHNTAVDRRVLSTDCDESPKRKKKPVDIWIEVYCEMEEKWITIELFKGKVHCVDSIRREATSPIAYVFAWNNDNSLKDVSPRYCPQWNTVTRKMRVEKEWLDDAIRSFMGKKNVRDKAEDRELEKIHLDKPLPQTISEYKNHPLYALKRHLLKFEGIYPPNAVTLGFVRGEPVYPRDCVHTLHSREIWLKSARVVKPKQQAYKIVKARPKWDKINSKVIKDLPLEIFGYWQTMEYEPPTAENGIVPRNAYGNVELFKACMLPKKTVHLTLPGLNRVCKKLQIDCAPAVIGFDFHQGSCHPLLDGFVVCEEFSDQVIEAWHKDQEEMERREEEKFEQRVYGNWKKLIKGLLIRQRLKKRYNFEDVGEGTSGGTTKKQKKK